MDFAKFINELRGGLTAQELGDELQRLSDQCAQTLKSGSLTLTITLEPAGGNRIKVADSISAKAPKPSRETTLFFQQDDYSLTRQAPHQVSLSILQEIDPK